MTHGNTFPQATAHETEAVPGGQLSPEKCALMTNHVTYEVMVAGRSKELTPKERELINETGFAISNTVQATLESGSLRPPTKSDGSDRWLSEIARSSFSILQDAGIARERIPATEAIRAGSTSELTNLLSLMATQNILQGKEYMAAVHAEYARAVTEYFNMMVQESGGLPIDDYLKGKLARVTEASDAYHQERLHKDALKNELGLTLQRLEDSVFKREGEDLSGLLNQLADRVVEMRAIDPQSTMARKFDAELSVMRDAIAVDQAHGRFGPGNYTLPLATLKRHLQGM